jgi:excinuclease ABC subunit A
MDDPTAIAIRNARLHNLAGLDLDLPRGRLIVLTGPSGSGKSSLAVDTLLGESRRRFVQTLSAQARRGGAPVQRPSVDRVAGLPPGVLPEAVLASRSPIATLGTVSEIQARLALLFARHGEVRCLSCNTPIRPASPEAVAALADTLPEGTRYLLTFPVTVTPTTRIQHLLNDLRRSGFTRARRDDAVIPLDDLEAAPPSPDAGFEVVVDRLVRGREDAARRRESIETALGRGMGRCRVVSEASRWTFTRDYRCPRCDRPHAAPRTALFLPTGAFGACGVCAGTGRPGGVEDATTRLPSWGAACPGCGGTRLRPEAGAVRIGPIAFTDFLREPVDALGTALAGLGAALGAAGPPALEGIGRRREAMRRLGLGGLPLTRGVAELSGGERRALAVALGLGSGFVRALYVFEHPLDGFEPAERVRVVAGLVALRDAGNTVLAIDHAAALHEAADHVVVLGPGSGRNGGRLVFAGPPADAPAPVVASRPGEPADRPLRPARGRLGLRLDGPPAIRLDLPLGQLVAVTGPTGSGKSRLLVDMLEPAVRLVRGGVATPGMDVTIPAELGEVLVLDRRPLRTSPRAVPGSIVGALDDLRRVFAATTEAKARGFDAGTFSFNRAGGRCQACAGLGRRTADLLLLPDEPVPCPVCGGTRFRAEVREVTYRGKSIADVLAMTVREAYFFCKNRPRVQYRLRPLMTLGLEYLTLGQPAGTLSGGEAQRVRLAGVLARARASETSTESARRSLVILDEPTAGLHPAEVPALLETLRELVDRGHSVVAIDNRPEAAAAADAVLHFRSGFAPGSPPEIIEKTRE